ncbi:aldose epimerase [Paenibacillus sp. GCM10027626]|uniref:aldose epimerase family protein n=1 Tax=Paenibacillus sp. GCM10027626 TaxID=3273411 RepID=UPI003642E7D8
MGKFTVQQHEDTYPLFTLTEEATDSAVTICPERGAIAIRCRLNGQELFYFDRDTFIKPDENIRGGNPILFPICGQLTDGRYEWEGVTYKMRNHGVVRNRPWEVVSASETDAAELTVRFRSNEDTRQEFPFDFELLFTYSLRNGELHLQQTYRNLSASGMPMYAGFHPYFSTSSKKIVYGTDATRYRDYNDHTIKEINGPIDLNGVKESYILLDATRPDVTIPGPDGQGTIRITYSEQFKYIVLWQLDERPFICVEPWMALPYELNRKEELPLLEAGQTMEAQFSIGYTAVEQDRVNDN